VTAPAHEAREGFLSDYRRLTVVFLGLLAAGTIAGIIVPAGPGWDFANFYDTGRRVVAGQIQDIYEPYSLILGRRPQGTMVFVGTPISAWLYVPLSYFSPGTALVIFKIQNTLAYFAALFLLYFHNRKFVEDSLIAQSWFAAMFAFLSLIYQPFWTVYRVGGQTTPTVLLPLTLTLLSYTTGRMFWSSLCLVVAALIKPAFLLVLGFLVLVSGARFFWYTAAIGASAGLSSVLVMGWPIHQEYFAFMAKLARISFPWFYNSSLYVLIHNLRPFIPVGPETASGTVFTVAATGVRVSILLTAIYLVIKSRPLPWTPPARRHYHFIMAVAFCLLFLPTVWEHYLSALFLPLAYIVASHRHHSR